MQPRCACGRPAELVDGSRAAVCMQCVEAALRAESERELEEEFAAVQRGDAAPEEVETARRQMRRVK